MIPQSCTYASAIPTPSTPFSSCAVPLGGSNTTILDTCCNGHINPIRTYSAPGAKDECYQYCTTEDAADVQECLNQNLVAGATGGPAFMCFNVPVEGSGNTRGGISWMMRIVIGTGILSVAVGSV